LNNLEALFRFTDSPLLAILPYCILALLAMAEGPMATLMGGAATANGLLLPLPAYLSIVIGNLTADMGWYSLGRFGKLERLIRHGPKFGATPEQIERLAKGIQKHAPRLLFLSKLTVGFPIPTLVATGLNRVPVRRWVVLLALGELLKSAVLVSIGYLYAQAIQQTTTKVQVTLWGITAFLFLAVLLWVRRHRE
jgi:membrane protein DedA with SNARE-associated domain